MKYIREWIRACELLRNYYEGKGDELDCPLCDVGARLNPDDACQYCLWNVFEGMDCSEYLKDVLKFQKYAGWQDVCDVRNHREPSWVKARIPMLTDWIKRLKKIQTKQRLVRKRKVKK